MGRELKGEQIATPSTLGGVHEGRGAREAGPWGQRGSRAQALPASALAPSRAPQSAGGGVGRAGDMAALALSGDVSRRGRGGSRTV